LGTATEPTPVAGGYLPCLFSWSGDDPTDAELASMRRRGHVIRLDRRRHMLLLSGGPEHPRDTVAEVARAIRARRPGAVVRTEIGRRAARHDALARLLGRFDLRDASAFVTEQLAALERHDREHGTTLLRVLELALDHPDRNAAAQAAFMHRNTFRRQLRTALALIDADLDCAEERLALHLALKMRARLKPAS
jgi:DNA-binding PucR family transcriptional regulator